MSFPLIKDTPRSSSNPLRIAVFVSGNGSNLQALIDEAKTPYCAYKICLVLSNEEHAFALTRAKTAGILSEVICHRDFVERHDYEEKLVEICGKYQIEVVILAGFMRVLGKTFLKAFSNRVINLHPALCPAFPGLHAVTQALKKRVWFTGCTVHLVNEGVDTGPILAQSIVPVLDGDDEASLSNRIQQEEHRLLPKLVQELALGNVIQDSFGTPSVKRAHF